MSNTVESNVSNDIPQDILLQIFYRLPVKSLGRFSCVSKSWFYLINNYQEQFHKFHMVKSQKKPDLIIDFEDLYRQSRFYIVEKQELGNTKNTNFFAYEDNRCYFGLYKINGYCNGLVCYWNCDLSSVYSDDLVYYFSFQICNPSRVEKLVTFSRLKIREGELIYGCRFGYDLVTNKYKVVCIVKYKNEYEYYIYTLGCSKPWRKMNNQWPKQHPMGNCDYDSKKRVSPVSCNGYIFYETIENVREKENYKRRALVALDLHGEKFQIIKLPGDDEFVSDYNNGYYSPSECKGCLCYSRMKKSGSYSGKVILYLLKDTVNHVWVKEVMKFVLPRELDSVTLKRKTKLHKRVAISRGIIVNFSDQVILCWMWYDKQNGDVILTYNVHTTELKEAILPYVVSSQYPSWHEFYNPVGFPFSSWSDFYISSHVENSLSLRTLETVTVEGRTRVNEYRYMSYGREFFDSIPKSNPEVLSFLRL